MKKKSLKTYKSQPAIARNTSPSMKPDICLIESPLQRLLDSVPCNYWTRDLWSFLQACLYVNGFPTEWSLDDLINPANHCSGSLSENKKLFGRVRRVLLMYQSANDHAKNGTLKHRLIGAEKYITPFEFARFCAAQKWIPVVKAFRELQQAPWNIFFAITDLFQERAHTPALASQITKNNSTSLRMLHKRQCESEAKKIYTQHLTTSGEELTPTQVYAHIDFQVCLRRLKNGKRVIGYDREMIIKRWIPAGLQRKLSPGRPRKKPM